MVGSAETDVNIQYISGFKAVDPVVCLHCGNGKTFIVVPAMEKLRALQERYNSKINVLTPADLNIPVTLQKQLVGWTLGLLNFTDIRKVTVSPFFPAGIAFELKRKKYVVEIAKKVLFPEREIKTLREINFIKKAQQAACAAMENAIKIISQARIEKKFLFTGKTKLTSERIREIIFHTLFALGCTAKEIIVACGKQAANPHCTGIGPLKAGETIVIDIFPKHVSGYWGDLTRTVIKGQPSDRWIKIYEAVLKAQQNAFAQIKPGKFLNAPHQAVINTFKELKMTTDLNACQPRGFIHGTGHGVGLEIHETPSLYGANKRIKAGHVFTVEPGWYEPGEGGVRIEDTVVVTKSGWSFLARCDKCFCI